MPIIFLLYLELVTAIFNGTPEKNFLRSISKWYSDNHKQGATDNLSLKASLKRDSLRSSQAQNIDISQDLGPSPKPSAILTLHITTGRVKREAKTSLTNTGTSSKIYRRIYDLAFYENDCFNYPSLEITGNSYCL